MQFPSGEGAVQGNLQQGEVVLQCSDPHCPPHLITVLARDTVKPGCGYEAWPGSISHRSMWADVSSTPPVLMLSSLHLQRPEGSCALSHNHTLTYRPQRTTHQDDALVWSPNSPLEVLARLELCMLQEHPLTFAAVQAPTVISLQVAQVFSPAHCSLCSPVELNRISIALTFHMTITATTGLCTLSVSC